MKKNIILVVISLLWSGSGYAADSDFAKGKQMFQKKCLVCHNADLDPPQAPPMFGVQMKYKVATSDRKSFIDKVTSFAIQPTKDKAILNKAVEVLGVMPDMGFKKSEVQLIAAYIYDEKFAPPCKHWRAAMRIFKERGDSKAFMHHKKRYDAMCRATSSESHVTPVKGAISENRAEVGTLKSIMQQLGHEYAALDRAILLEDFSAAATAADHIANHEKPSMFQRMKIMAGLRTEMSTFKQADGKVHQLAMEIKQAAESKNLSLLIQRQSGMLSACMACHSSYRQRVMKLLR